MSAGGPYRLLERRSWALLGILILLGLGTHLLLDTDQCETFLGSAKDQQLQASPGCLERRPIASHCHQIGRSYPWPAYREPA